MKKIINLIYIVVFVAVATACTDDDKIKFPEFERAASLRAIPSPWTLRPTISLANPTIAFSMSSYNVDELSSYDIYVSLLTSAQATTIAPIPAAPATAITINYISLVANSTVTTYDRLITVGTPPPVTKALLRSVSGQLEGDQAFTVAELTSALGISPASLTAGQAFILTFEVTMTNGKTYTYRNGTPDILNNPAPTPAEGSQYIPGVVFRIVP